MYHGRTRDLSMGGNVPEKDLAKRVVKDLVGPFVGLNHVVYSCKVKVAQQQQTCCSRLSVERKTSIIDIYFLRNVQHSSGVKG